MDDGKGKKEQIGTAVTANECAALVLRKRPDADGVEWGAGIKLGAKLHGSCWAQFGTKGVKRNAKSDWVGCMLNSMICLQDIV